MEPILVPAGDGELVHDGDGKRVEIVADLPALVAVANAYAAGTRGPAPHVHREHLDCFWVLEGALAFTLGDEAREIPAGGWLAVPRGVAHSFVAATDTRFLNLHAPGCGFGAFLRGERAAAEVDQHPVPAGGGAAGRNAVVLLPGDDGGAMSMGGSHLRFALEHADGLSLTELALAPGFPGPLPHRHAVMTDSFYVVAGRPTFLVGERRVEAGPGTWVSVPPGHVHTFAGHPEDPVRLLNAMAPGGLEQYLKEVAARAAGGPPDPAVMAELASGYDFAPA